MKTENEMIADLLVAKRKAEAAINVSDNAGTCNFDHPMVKLPKAEVATFISAAEACGIRAEWCSSRDWGGWIDLRGAPGSRYQGAARTAGAEAVAAELTARGYEATVFYMMD